MKKHCESSGQTSFWPFRVYSNPAQLHRFFSCSEWGENLGLLLQKNKGLSLQVGIHCIAPKEEAPGTEPESGRKPNSHIPFSL